MTSALAWAAGPAAAYSHFAPAPSRARLPPAAVWLALARRALAAGDPARALHCFEAALRHEGALPVAHLGRAVCFAQLGRDAEAETALGEVLASARGEPEGIYHLARMCAAQGESALALPLLREATRARPALEEAALRNPLFADHPVYLTALGRL